jgi:hypothetical protein
MNKLFSLLGAAIAWTRKGGSVKEGYEPYADGGCNLVYNLLFCDKLELFRKTTSTNPQGVWATVLAQQPYAAGLAAIAGDTSQESRLRALAYNRLSAMKQAVPAKKLLGVIVEVGMQDGLDVLAAYPDGNVRYINHKESLSVYEPAPKGWMPNILKLLAAAQDVIEQIGPWEKPRIAPPTAGMIRMSFLVSDGLYFGQGPMAMMERDAMVKPVIVASVELLKLVAADANSDGAAR